MRLALPVTTNAALASSYLWGNQTLCSLPVWWPLKYKREVSNFPQPNSLSQESYPSSWAAGKHPVYSVPQGRCTALSGPAPGQKHQWGLVLEQKASNDSGTGEDPPVPEWWRWWRAQTWAQWNSWGWADDPGDQEREKWSSQTEKSHYETTSKCFYTFQIYSIRYSTGFCVNWQQNTCTAYVRTSASSTILLPSGQMTWSTWERTLSHVSSGVRRLACRIWTTVWAAFCWRCFFPPLIISVGFSFHITIILSDSVFDLSKTEGSHNFL